MSKPLLDHIIKTSGGYKLVSKKTGKNLGKAKTKAGIEKRERQVQFFKHQHEEVVAEKKIGLMKILTPVQKVVRDRVDNIIKGNPPDQKKESVAEMAPVDELISFAQYFEMVQFDGDPRMMKDPLTRNPLDRGPVTGTQYSENDTGGNGDAGIVGGLTPPDDSDLPANIAKSPGGYSKNINTPGIPMTMGESPIKQFIRGKFVEPTKLKDKYSRPKPKLKEERPILNYKDREITIPKKGK